MRATDGLDGRVVIVVEGKARSGAKAGVVGSVEVVHATGEGDDTIAAIAAANTSVTVVTADQALIARVRAAGADVVGPNWLLDRLTD